MHKVLVNHLGDLSLPRKSVVRLTDRLDMTLDVYRGRKTTTQQQPAYPIFDEPRRSRFSCLVSIHVLYVGTKLMLIESFFNKILTVKHGY